MSGKLIRKMILIIGQVYLISVYIQSNGIHGITVFSKASAQNRHVVNGIV